MRLYLIFVLTLFSLNVFAEEDKTGDDIEFSRPTNNGLLSDILLAETSMLLMSRIISNSPNDWGYFSALIAIPIVTSDMKDNTATKTAAFISMEAIAINNINIDQDSTTKSQNFKDNFRAMNIAAGLTILISHLTTDKSPPIRVLPTRYNGLKFSYDYNF